MSPSPELTVIVIFYNMRREARRTLFTLTPSYQRGVTADQYKVVAIDNGSSEPLDPEEVRSFGSNFHYIYESTNSPSPVKALNRAIKQAQTTYVMCIIDGARMLSPGILFYTFSALRAFRQPFVYSIGMYLGHQVQPEAMLQGYNQQEEDRLLESIHWRDNGYLLFKISCFAGTSKGFFTKTAESNCFTIKRDLLLDMGGFDEGFTSPGGGLVNLDLFKRIVEQKDIPSVALIGEAVFHQFHGGVATNSPRDENSPLSKFFQEYQKIRGEEYQAPTYSPHFWGHISAECKEFFGIKSKKFGLAKHRLNSSMMTKRVEQAVKVNEVAPSESSNTLAEEIFAYEKALELNPNHPNIYEAYVALANMFYQLEKTKEAVIFSEKAIKIKPEQIAAYQVLGNAQLKSEDFSGAIAAYEKALELHPTPPFGLYKNLGDALRKENNIEKAIAAYQEAQKLQSKNRAIQQTLAKLIDQQQKSKISSKIESRVLEPIDLDQYISNLQLGERAKIEFPYPQLLKFGPNIIGGTGGSGTRVIARITQQGGLFLGTNRTITEDNFELGMYLKLREIIVHYQSPMLAEKYTLAIQLMRSGFCKYLEALNSNQSLQSWGWKIPTSIFALPFLHKQFPKIKTIHLVRDGRDMAYSKNQNQLTRLGPFILNSEELSWSKPLKSIALWSKLNLLAAEYGEKYMPTQYLRIRFEDLCTRPVPTIERIFDFFGLSGDVPQIAQSEVTSPESLGRWRNQDGKEVAQLERIGKVALEKFEYLK